MELTCLPHHSRWSLQLVLALVVMIALIDCEIDVVMSVEPDIEIFDAIVLVIRFFLAYVFDIF